MNEILMPTDTSPPRREAASAAPGAVVGVFDEQTMSHLLDVELARARRYEHPFAVLQVSAGGDAAVRQRIAGVLRFHTRWADSVGEFAAALLVILRDTAPDGARFAGEKIAAALAAELGEMPPACRPRIASAAWRKGDDRARLLARLS